jgi:hypothetical protein
MRTIITINLVQWHAEAKVSHTQTRLLPSCGNEQKSNMDGENHPVREEACQDTKAANRRDLDTSDGHAGSMISHGFDRILLFYPSMRSSSLTYMAANVCSSYVGVSHMTIRYVRSCLLVRQYLGGNPPKHSLLGPWRRPQALIKSILSRAQPYPAQSTSPKMIYSLCIGGDSVTVPSGRYVTYMMFGADVRS